MAKTIPLLYSILSKCEPLCRQYSGVIILINYFLRSLIDWVFRKRSAGLALVRIGVPLFGLVLAGLTVGVTIPSSRGNFILSWDSSGSTGALSWGVFIIAILIVLLGISLIVRDIRWESRKKVIVIEARGLRDYQGQPLATSVPSSILGRREQVIIDLRKGGWSMGRSSVQI
ncbi:hypothetical protein [Serratia plymuthica]|uniref:hypothetical protein n=1 Tax=Serratia plymuthica TaxID=82996 RepID=UPI00338F25F1